MYPFGGGSNSTGDLQGSLHYHSGRGTTREITTQSLQTPAPSAGRGSATTSQSSTPTHRVDKPSRKGRHRKRFEENERRLVAAVRKVGACEECHNKKVKCIHRRQALSSTSQTSTYGEAPRPPTSDFDNLSISATYPTSSSGLSATCNFEEPPQYNTQHGNYSIASFVTNEESSTPFSTTIINTSTSWGRRRQVVASTLNIANIHFTPATPISRQIDPFPANQLPIQGTFEESTPIHGPQGKRYKARKDADILVSDEPTNYANTNPIIESYGRPTSYEPTIASGSQFHQPPGSWVPRDQGDVSHYTNYQTSHPQPNPWDIELPQAYDSTRSFQPTQTNLEGAYYPFNNSFTNSQSNMAGAHTPNYPQPGRSSGVTNQYYSNSLQQNEGMDEDNYGNSQTSQDLTFWE